MQQFNKLQFMQQFNKLQFMQQFNKLQFMQQFDQNFLPSSFNDTWVKNLMRNIGKNDIQLRNFDQLRLSHANLSTLDLFPWYNFPQIWQEFPDEQIKIICKPSEFDAKLKNYFLSDLASIVVCSRLFCPACTQAGCLRQPKLYYPFLPFTYAAIVSVCLVWSFRDLFNNLSKVYWWNLVPLSLKIRRPTQCTVVIREWADLCSMGAGANF